MSESLSASTSVLAFVAGKDENVNDLNSTFPDTSPGAPFKIDDRLFYGDTLPELPETLAEAVFATKQIDGLDGSYRQFRFKNTLQIDYITSTDGHIQDDTITVRVNSRKDDDTVTIKDTTGGSSSEFEAGLQLLLPGSPEPPSYTILASDYRQKSDLFKYLFGSQKMRADTYRRYVKAHKGIFQNPDGIPVEGIRAATIWGTANPYTQQLLQFVGADDTSIPNPLFGDLLGSITDPNLPDNPIIYSWMELTLLADGTTYVRVPDASVFPKHVGYLCGPLSNGVSTKRDTNGLDVILDENTNPSDDRYAVAIREDTNHVWDRFTQEANQGVVVPYKSSNSIYHENYNNVKSSLYNHPIMAYGEAGDGRTLDHGETLDKLPHDPLFPMIVADFFLPIV